VILAAAGRMGHDDFLKLFDRRRKHHLDRRSRTEAIRLLVEYTVEQLSKALLKRCER
jgi:hypothetical protein